MHIYRRKKSPDWYFSVHIGSRRYRRPTGVPLTESKRKAERAANLKIDEIKAGLAREKKGEITLNDACSRYFQEVAQHQPSGDDAVRGLALLCKRLGKTRLLSDPIDSDLARYVAKRRADRTKAGKLVSSATVNRDTELLRRVYRRAATVWRLNVSMPDWKAHKLPEPTERVRELLPSEESSLFLAIRPDYLPLIEFALLSGIRLSNLIRLTWKNVSDGRITIKVKSKKPGGKVIVVPITSVMQSLLNQQKGRSLFVFTYECKRSRGKRKAGERYPFSQNGWRKDWKKALAAAGIDDFRFHDLRHTAATRIMRLTGNLKLVGKMLGHSDISATARYAHVTHDDLEKAMESAHSSHKIGHTGDDADDKALEDKEEIG